MILGEMGDQKISFKGDTLIESFILNKGVPPTVCIELSKLCNLSCSYCRSESSPFQKQKIDFDSLANLLSKLKKLGDWRISLTGGEPTLWKNLIPLIDLINALEFNYCITTNGFSSQSFFTKLSEEQLQKSTIKVSLDGNNEIHNSLRGKNSFENAISFMEQFQNKFPRLSVNTTLIKHPKFWASELCNELKKLKIYKWSVISPISTSQWNEITEQNYQEQFDFVSEIHSSSGSQSKLSFLDYNSLSETGQTVVFIESNGNISLPVNGNSQTTMPTINTEGVEHIIFQSVISSLQNGVPLQ